jgi:small subunit ribosomal protein S17
MAKTLTGVVSSVAPNKTIVITIHTRKTHPLYKKQYSVTSKFMAHDENNDCNVGDKVVIVETRPLSARKRYTLQEIVQRAELTQADKQAIVDSEKDAETAVEEDK